MKFPAAAFLWLMIPLAAAVGYYGGRHRAEKTAIAAQGQKDSATVGAGQGAGGLPAREKAGTDERSSGVVTRWADRLRHCRVEELPGLYAEIQALAPEAGKLSPADFPTDDNEVRRREEYEVALRLLCCRWAELDAPRGLVFLREMMNTGAGHGFFWLLTEWALRDPTAAHEAVMALPEEDERRNSLLESVGTEIMGAGADAFWEWFKVARTPMPREGTATFWRRLATAHFEELSDIAASGPPPSGAASGQPWNPAGLYQALAAVMAGREGEGALKWAESQPEPVRNAALKGALEGLITRDPGKAAGYLTGIRDGRTPLSGSSDFEIGQIGQKVLRAMSLKDPLGTLEWFQANGARLNGGDSYGGEALAAGLSAAMRDGRLTSDQAFSKVSAARLDDGHQIHLGVLHRMWLGLPADQLANAAQWLGTAASGEERDSAMRGLFPAWAAQDRAAAMRFAAGTGDPGMAKAMFEGLTAGAAGGWSESAGDRVATVLREVPPEHRAQAVFEYMRTHHIGHTGNHLPFFDGAVMARTIEGLAPADSTVKAAALIAERWAATDPASAIAWAWDREDAALREKATGAAVESWAREDAWGASEWIEAQPPGERRDRAAHHLARVLRADDPESAWTWAGSIGDPAIRQEARAAVLRMWRDSLAAAARVAVDSLPGDALSLADRQKLTDTLLPAGGGK